MKLAAFNLVVGEDGLQEFGKNSCAFFEKELAVWRRRRNDDVAPLFSFGAKVPREDPLDSVHRLRTTAERENGRIRFRRVVSVRQDHFVLDRPASHLLRLVDYLRA